MAKPYKTFEITTDIDGNQISYDLYIYKEHGNPTYYGEVIYGSSTQRIEKVFTIGPGVTKKDAVKGLKVFAEETFRKMLDKNAKDREIFRS